VPLTYTFLYTMIARILVDVVDAVLNGSGVEKKWLGGHVVRPCDEVRYQ